LINIEDYRILVTDFDGVHTDNKVLVSSDGQELVSCSRSDGIAYDYLRKKQITSIILSSETNSVVKERANKLKIKFYGGVSNKLDFLERILLENLKSSLDKVIYIGNDLNDYLVMEKCGLKVCPSDSHPRIIEISDFVIQKKGGDGVIRSLIEDVFEIDLIEMLYR